MSQEFSERHRDRAGDSDHDRDVNEDEDEDGQTEWPQSHSRDRDRTRGDEDRDGDRKRGKAPLHQCDECGERLYMTLTGVRCFNCWSADVRPVSVSEASEETLRAPRASMGANSGGERASPGDEEGVGVGERGGEEERGEGEGLVSEEGGEDEGEGAKSTAKRVQEVIAAPVVSRVIDLRERSEEREGGGEAEEVENTS